MLTLGIEGTSHTIGAGIVRDNAILSSITHVYFPKKGGIQPREAANHHFDHIKDVVDEAFRVASIAPRDIDLVSFSRGPGLGPCLRVAATAARAISLKFRKPIVGVNHAMGHLEVARAASGFVDPAVLYVSGGNTQVIMHSLGFYRVFGETMDIGLGNMLDKLARGIGYAFPGGPVIERLASEGKKLLDLPYSVKGMDTAFSGILTAAQKHLTDGKKREDVAYSVQETTFSMVLECLERGLKHMSKDEIILTGGVAINKRFREMFSELGKSLGIRYYAAEPQHCGDNGAMIAIAGSLIYGSSGSDRLEDTWVNQRFRIDEVPSPWIEERWNPDPSMKGAEASLTEEIFRGRKALRKQRLAKSYRIPELDHKIRKARILQEFQVLHALDRAGIGVPIVYGFDPDRNSLTVERIEGKQLRDISRTGTFPDILNDLISIVDRMHRCDISHGDLTLSNIMINRNGELLLIDPSMGTTDATDEEKAVDLFLLEESMRSSGIPDPESIEAIYNKLERGDSTVIEKLNQLKKRRRYV